MTRDPISAASTNFFLTAALLALFGMAALNQAGPHGALQLGLAVVMAAAGFLLRSGTAEARLIGLGAAGLTTTVGAVLLVSGGYYVPGTIIAIFALFRLAGASAGVVHPDVGPAPAHLPAHLPPWSPGQGAPVPPPPAPAFGAPVPPPAAPYAPQPSAPRSPAGQEWDYYGKPT